MKKILFYTLFGYMVILNAQEPSNPNYCCTNFWKESLAYLENPDTIFIAVDYTSHTRVNKNEIQNRAGRNIIFVFKKNNEWQSALAMYTVENNKNVFYITPTRSFPLYIDQKHLNNLFDTCFQDVQKLIEYKKKNIEETSGRNVRLYIRKGDAVFEIPFHNVYSRGDMICFYGSEYNSFYTMYSLGLTNSVSLFFPFKMKCEAEPDCIKNFKKRRFWIRWFR
jgi:hypothetical protein